MKKKLLLYLVSFIICLSLQTFAQSREELQKAQQFINEGYAAAGRGDFAAAVENYTKAINIYPKLPQMFFNRGTAYLHIKQPDSAIKDFDKAIEMGANLPDEQLAAFYMNRGLAYMGKDDYKKSIEDFDKSIGLKSKDVRVYINRGNAHSLMKNYDLAAADYQKSLEITPHPHIFYNLARIYYEKRNFEQAIKNFTKTIEMDSQFAEAYSSRGLSYKYKGDLDSALLDLTKAISLANSDGVYYFNRAGIYLQKGSLDQAVKDYTKALEIYPLWAEAFRRRAEAHKKQGQIKLAEADLQKAAEVAKENVNPLEKHKLIIP